MRALLCGTGCFLLLLCAALALPRSSRLVEGGDGLGNKHQPSEVRVAMLVFATGNYIDFLEPLVASVGEHFCSQSTTNVHKHVVIFTDQDNKAKALLQPLQTDTLTTSIVHVDQVGWPDDSMKRVHHILANEAEWETSDFVINIDSDAVFRAEVCREFLVPSFGVWHTYFYKSPKAIWTLESRTESNAYVDAEKANAYFRGGLWGGNRTEFKIYAQEIMKRTDMDLNQDPPIVPIWHDESVLNRVYFDRPPNTTLSPYFMYPEPPGDLWLTTTWPDRWVSPDRKTRLDVIKIVDSIKENSQMRRSFGETDNESNLTRLDVIRDVTIVIPHFDRRKCLERLLTSLIYRYAGVRIIVVDSSMEYNDEYYLRDDKHLSVIHLEPDAGVSAMRNAGARQAKTPYVLFLDDDILLLSKTRLELMLHALVEGGVDGVAGHLTEKQDDTLDTSEFAWDMGTSNGWMLTRNGTTVSQTDAVVFEKDHMSQSIMALKNSKSQIIPNCYHADMVENALLIRTDSFSKNGGLFWDDNLKLGEHEDFFLRGAELNRRFAFCHGFGFMFGNDHGKNCADQRAFETYKKDRKRQLSNWVTMFRKHELNKLVTGASNYSLSCGTYQDIPTDPSCTVVPDNQWDIWYENEVMPEDAPSEPSQKNFKLSHEAQPTEEGRLASMLLLEPGSFVEVSNTKNSQFAEKRPFSVEFWVFPTSQTKGTAASSYAANSQNGQFYVGVDGGVVSFFRNTENGKSLTSEMMSRYVWHHVVVSYDGEKQYIFIDTVLSASSSSGTVISNEVLPLCIGSQWGNADEDNADVGFFGTISEVRVWSKAFNKSEDVSVVMKTPVARTVDHDIVCAFNFNNIRNGVIKDMNSGGANGLHHGRFHAAGVKIARPKPEMEDIDVEDSEYYRRRTKAEMSMPTSGKGKPYGKGRPYGKGYAYGKGRLSGKKGGLSGKKGKGKGNGRHYESYGAVGLSGNIWHA